MPLISLNQAIASLIEVVSERAAQGGVVTVGIPSGFKSIDAVTGGFRKSALYILAGRPGMGKTAMGLIMAMNIANANYKVLFLSLEMSAELLALRALSAITGIPSEKIERGMVDKAELTRIKEAVQVTANIDFNIFDDTLTSEQFVQALDRRVDKVDFVVVDYVSLFRDSSHFGETERLTRISGTLAATARALDIPILLLSQLNREVEKRENHVPILSDLRDSGALEQDAFLVAFAYRPYYYEMMFDDVPPLTVEDDASIIIAKNRQGATGQIKLRFYPQQMKWTDVGEAVVSLPPPTQVVPPQAEIPSTEGPLTRRVKEGRLL